MISAEKVLTVKVSAEDSWIHQHGFSKVAERMWTISEEMKDAGFSMLSMDSFSDSKNEVAGLISTFTCTVEHFELEN